MQLKEIRLLESKRLAELCREHVERYRRDPNSSDGRYCYELIRRAVWHTNEDWNYIHDLFYSRIAARIRSDFSQESDKTVDDLIQDTIIRFYQYVTPATWSKFPDIACLLAFIDKCAYSQLINFIRIEERKQRLGALWEGSPSFDIEETIQDQAIRARIWECVMKTCKDPYDELLAELIFVLDLKPREIAAQYPDEFADVSVVYAQKRNLKERLQRAPCMQQLWQEVHENDE